MLYRTASPCVSSLRARSATISAANGPSTSPGLHHRLVSGAGSPPGGWFLSPTASVENLLSCSATKLMPLRAQRILALGVAAPMPKRCKRRIMSCNGRRDQERRNQAQKISSGRRRALQTKLPKQRRALQVQPTPGSHGPVEVRVTKPRSKRRRVRQAQRIQELALWATRISSGPAAVGQVQSRRPGARRSPAVSVGHAARPSRRRWARQRPAPLRTRAPPTTRVPPTPRVTRAASPTPRVPRAQRTSPRARRRRRSARAPPETIRPSGRGRSPTGPRRTSRYPPRRC